jgi:hypothetical protein
MKTNKILKIVAFFIIVSTSAFAQKKQQIVGFDKIEVKTVNRSISKDSIISMNANKGDGLVIFENIAFKKGTIELDLLGQNLKGKSFVGFAFNIEDNATYEAVYFRPFNFLAKEATRKSHMLQYICQPKYTWRELRTTRTGEFENEIKIPPNPEDWFHLKIEVGEKKVSVYVNDSKTPDLVIERLRDIKTSKIGLWVGNGSSGKFKGLKINN